MEVDDIQKKRWNNSLRNSIVIHLLLLLLVLFFPLPVDPTQNIDTQYAVAISFQEVEFKASKSSNSSSSQASTGAQRARSETPAKLETASPSTVETPKPTAQSKPQPTQPTTQPRPTEPVISKTTTEESEIQAIEEPIDVKDPEPEYIPQKSPAPKQNEEAIILNPDLPSLADIIGTVSDDPIETKEEKVPSKNPGTGSKNSPTTGTSSNDPSLKDGSGSGKADAGTGKGKDASGKDSDSGIGTGGAGEGAFDDSGDGIFGRKVLVVDPEMQRIMAGSSKSGKIVFRVCIDRRGNVSFVEVNNRLTTMKDNNLIKQALNSMAKYKYEVDYTAPKEQCGQFTVILDTFRGIRPK